MLKVNNVDEYIGQFPENVQEILEKIRQIIKKNAPDATEEIAYGMPAYKLNKKPLVYYAGFSKHIGFYAVPSGHAAFAEELSIYKGGKGSVQFPLNQTVPFDLIERIVNFRVKENMELKK